MAFTNDVRPGGFAGQPTRSRGPRKRSTQRGVAPSAHAGLARGGPGGSQRSGGGRISR
jgi:hypothetical protein